MTLVVRIFTQAITSVTLIQLQVRTSWELQQAHIFHCNHHETGFWCIKSNAAVENDCCLNFYCCTLINDASFRPNSSNGIWLTEKELNNYYNFKLHKWIFRSLKYILFVFNFYSAAQMPPSTQIHKHSTNWLSKMCCVFPPGLAWYISMIYVQNL